MPPPPPGSPSSPTAPFFLSFFHLLQPEPARSRARLGTHILETGPTIDGSKDPRPRSPMNCSPKGFSLDAAFGAGTNHVWWGFFPLPLCVFPSLGLCHASRAFHARLFSMPWGRQQRCQASENALWLPQDFLTCPATRNERQMCFFILFCFKSTA